MNKVGGHIAGQMRSQGDMVLGGVLLSHTPSQCLKNGKRYQYQ
uniref:Uncharacterized protein n=1 Tax=Lotus japonicus TaxID=34305 RepID=I3SWW3_LOTJA|nr:unknown [Lotus japonicus]